MLIHSIGRAANSTNTLYLVASRSGGVFAQQAASNSTSSSRHQRRRSSKTSHPPGNPNGSEEAPSDASSKSTVAERTDQHRAERRSNGVVPRKKTKAVSNADAAAAKTRDDGFANAPAVPSTQHLNQADVHLSSLFALHRPISLTSSIPPSSTQSAFKNIFELPRSSQKTWQNMMAFTVQHDGMVGAEQSGKGGAGRRQMNGLQSSEPIHIDGAPSVEQLMKQFRPFQKPPPPVPFDEAGSVQPDGQDQAETLNVGEPDSAQDEQEMEAVTHKKMFKTTLTVEEVTHPSGEKTYTSTASPIVEQQQTNDQEDQEKTRSPPNRQPYLRRVRARAAKRAGKTKSTARRTYDQKAASVRGELGAPLVAEEPNFDRTPAMHLISVKRQRKLKMKKHKYKKLMRRTRNLRRREGRN
ncbi:MAG: hypothetical protein M1831_002333 [Alyxoria varia]|nr:MAG: hypothetical protein M1831_002333 [Alyxoria varia]